MVGPLDSQIVINQSAATEKVQEVQQRHPDLQQKQFALRLQEEQERKQRDIRDTERADQVLIRDRRQRRDQRRGGTKNRKDRMEEVSLREESQSDKTGGRVDLFV